MYKSLSVNNMDNTLSIAFFGTSLTQHLEGYVLEIYNQLDLPKIGDSVKVAKWRKRGFVAMLEHRFAVANPNLDLDIDNLGVGGANSLRVLEEIGKQCRNKTYSLIFLECGTNDILRGFQGRDAESVDIDIFANNYMKMLDILLLKTDKVFCLTIPPVSNGFEYKMNSKIKEYNDVICKIARERQCLLINLYKEFERVNKSFKDRNKSLWADGLHLNEMGDTLVANIIVKTLDKHEVFSEFI
ncbi:MAG: hypothetical protein GY793_08810 [Proteobacteria bacterium]|nr:hypothetical protein [Pseudomonadota bacterium]